MKKETNRRSKKKWSLNDSSKIDFNPDENFVGE